MKIQKFKAELYARASIAPSFWKFHVVVVQNKGKGMYKKSVLHVQTFFFG